MSSPALSLNSLVNVSVFVSPQSAVAPQFNVGLIVGTSTVIPSFGTRPRIRSYTSASAILADGFTTSNPEYIAANLYFSQTPTPTTVQIGRQDLTSLLTVIPHSGGAGTGYKVGDVIGVTQGGASAGFVSVTTVGGSGNVTGLQVVTAQDGTGYSVANSLATTGGSGTGLTVDISAVGETPLIAIQNCRSASSVWWAVLATAAVAADHQAIVPVVQTMQPVSAYFYTTGDAAVLAGTTPNVGSVLQAAGYTRALGVYSTTQGGAFPNNIYAAAAAMGVMMGLNTGLSNSNFTLMFKVMTGIAAETLTPAQIATVQGFNLNLYVGYVNQYTILQTGTTPLTGTFIDQVLNRDILTAAIQFNIMNLLTQLPSVPQDDAGQTQLLHAVNQACQAAVVRGYIAPGVWKGVNILDLTTGQPLPAGYMSQSPSFNTQLTADTLLRKSMPVYLAIIEAGSIQSVVIGVYIQP